MILFGHLLLANDSEECVTQPGTVRVDDGIITEVNLGDSPKHFDIGGPDALISPGFIDTHLHLPQFDLIGAHGMPLLQWLGEVTFPSEMKWADVDFARAMTDRVVDQLISVGTTGVAAYATVHHESAAAAIETLAGRGVRGVVGQVLMDRQAPADLCRSAGQLIDEAARLQSMFPAGNRVSAAVTPRFAISCSGPLLESAGKLAAETGAIVQTHLAETRQECELVQQLFNQADYVDVYRDAGLLTDRSVLGHGIHLTASDRRKLQQSGAVIAHCPTANSFLRSGSMSWADLNRDSVKLALGSDIGAGYERSMVRVARSMIETAATLGEQYPTAAQAWYAITAGNADALSWSDAGRIVVGASADLVVIEPTIPWQTGASPPLAMLMFAWDDRWITKTLLNGGRE
ncbi:amidohydrolase family protein [Rubripirellula reticaptiva]|uniref:Guanine deaminase n=1 Tax=Rubripirellula reticaptiva TaxID=2528013 RepID=A0A5C6ES29_9BACT|nr:amidohydrolase family protein [Rubripirellula reticaptiva]TWU51812.1 Guanine deaminase [Rubripirellula reticaptiva]